MFLEPETVEKISKAYEADFGEGLTAEEVYEISSNLVGFFELLVSLNNKYDVVNVNGDE